MATNVFVLRPHQAADLEEVIRYLTGGASLVAILYCTGAGKSAMALALAARLMAKKGDITHVVIAGPTNTIINQFHMGECDRIQDLSGQYAVVKLDDRTRKTEESVTIFRYLGLRRPGEIIRTSHAACVGLLRERALRDCCGKMLILDESHIAAEGNKLHAFRQAWIDAGGQVVMLTATPDRDDGKLALPPGTPFVKRTLPEMMRGGKYAPERLVSEVIQVAGCVGVGDTDSIARPKDADAVQTASLLVDHMLAEGWPKSLLRVRNAGGLQNDEGVGVGRATNHSAIHTYAVALKAQGRRVFVASEGHVGTKIDLDDELARMNQDVLDAVRAARRRNDPEAKDGDGSISEVRDYERSVTRYQDSCVDVIIGMDTVVLGFDWPLCSHIYFLGVPYDVTPALSQGVGRVMRLRSDYANYPEAWRNRSKVVFVTAPTKSTEKLRQAWLDRMSAVCAYLSTFAQWTPRSDLSQLLTEYPHITPEEEAEARRTIDARTIPEADVRRIMGLMLPHVALAELHWRYSQKLVRKHAADITMAALAHYPEYAAHPANHSAEAWKAERKLVLQVLAQADLFAPEQIVAATRKLIASGRSVNEAMETALDEHLAASANKPLTGADRGLFRRMVLTLEAADIDRVGALHRTASKRNGASPVPSKKRMLVPHD